jgi:hypothetical protein
LWFLFLGVGVIAGDLAAMNLSQHSFPVRLTANVLYLASAFEVARRVALLLF